MIHQFWGSEVCCGTYACMNYLEKAGDTRIKSYKDFEIAASIPFGIRYIERPYYDRMLTPLCNPNQGINRAAKLYGYEVEQYHFQAVEELMQWLGSHLVNAPVILGPIDMGKLFYLPMSSVYRASDHYVVLSHVSDDRIEILESEGMGRMIGTYEELRKSIGIENIPEAEGLLAVRRLIWTRDVSEEEIVRYSWDGAVENYYNIDRYGENCFVKCSAVVKNVPSYVWRNSLLYECGILLQRKHLFLRLLDKAWREGIIEKGKKERMEDTIGIQSVKLGELLVQIKKDRIDQDIFKVLGELEDRIGWQMFAGKDLERSRSYGSKGEASHRD